MAKILNKDPFTYHEEYITFIQDLHQFHSGRGTPFYRIPEIRGREIDLYLLYRRVIASGGWRKVNQDLKWDDLIEDFSIPRHCANGAHALKLIYIRFLDIYEKVNFFGENPDLPSTPDEDRGPVKKKVYDPISYVPMVYHTELHKISDATRQAYGMSQDLVKFSDYEKLEQSLLCGLPNEVDFAINVCTLLSNEGRHVLRLNKTRHLLQLLLAHVGIFTAGPGSYLSIYETSWKHATKRKFLQFWYDTVDSEEIRLLINPPPEPKQNLLGYEVLNMGREIGVEDVEGQRVLQMAIILRNLSFEDENMQLLASSNLVFRFLMLCCHCNHGCIRQIGMDTFGNLATQMVLEPVDYTNTEIMLQLLYKCVASPDKGEVVKGLEILSKLCQVDDNESLISDNLQHDTYEKISHFLTIQDIQLIVWTLEALYQLSELGEATTTHIAGTKSTVDTLVNLTTIEAQSFGPNSLMGIKVVEHIPTKQVEGGLDKAEAIHANEATPKVSAKSVKAATGGIAQFATKSDVESTTCNWLQATYDSRENGTIAQIQLYSDYLIFCKKYNILAPLPAMNFVSCFRVVFPTAQESKTERADGTKEVFIKGVCKRSKPKPFSITSALPASASACGLPSRVVGTNPLAVGSSPTLRQRLQEPPRMSIPLHLLHSGAQTTSLPPQSQPLPPTSATKKIICKKELDYSSALGNPYTPPDKNTAFSQQYNSPVNTGSSVQLMPPRNSPVLTKKIKKKSTKVVLNKKSTQPMDVEGDFLSIRSQSPSQRNGVPTPEGELRRPADSNMIKTLLAKKLNQNMVWHNQNPPQGPTQAQSPVAILPCQGPVQAHSPVAILPCPDPVGGTAAPGYSAQSVPAQNLPFIDQSVPTFITRPHSDTPPNQPFIARPHSDVTGNPSAQSVYITKNIPIQPRPPSSQSEVRNKIPLPPDKPIFVPPPDDPDDPNQPIGQPGVFRQPPVTVKCNGTAAVVKDGTACPVVGTFISSGFINNTGQVGVFYGTPQVLDTSNILSGATPGTPQPSQVPSTGPVVAHSSQWQKPATTASAKSKSKKGNSSPGRNSPVRSSSPKGTTPPKRKSSTGSRPGSPRSASPRSYELAVCGEVERAKDIVPEGMEAVIEKVENKGLQMHLDSLQTPSNKTDKHIAQSEHICPTQTADTDKIISKDQLPSSQSECNTQSEVEQMASDVKGADKEMCERLEKTNNNFDTTGYVNGCIDDIEKPLDKLPPLKSSTEKAFNLTSNEQAPLINGLDSNMDKDEIFSDVLSPENLNKAVERVMKVNGIGHHLGNGDHVLGKRKLFEQVEEIIHLQDQSSKSIKSNYMEKSDIRVPENGTVVNGLHNSECEMKDIKINESGATVDLKMSNKINNENKLSEIVETQEGNAQITACNKTLEKYPNFLNKELVETDIACKAEETFSCESIAEKLGHSERICPKVHLPMTDFPREAETSCDSFASSIPEGNELHFAINKLAVNPVETTSVVQEKVPKSGDKPSRSRKRSRNTTGSADVPSSSGSELMCEWSGCKRCFDTAKQVFSHVHKTHILVENDGLCKWESCEHLQRQKWSLITHVQDHHCMEQALQVAAKRRKSTQNKSGANPSMIYPKDAAIQAIRRFSARPPFPEMLEPKEGPVTKHIRLTAALVLRNLARYSSLGRSLIKKHERHLSYSALSAVEASGALSNCLWEVLHDH